MKSKARNFPALAALVLIALNTTGLALRIHIHTDKTHHPDGSDNTSKCPVCQQAVFSGKYCIETAEIGVETPVNQAIAYIAAFDVYSNQFYGAFKIRPPPQAFC